MMKLKIPYSFLFVFGLAHSIQAQLPTDSVSMTREDSLLLYQPDDSVQLNEVTINAYFGEDSILTLPASISIVDSAILQQHHNESFVAVMNTVPGVRMEERSAGSYRLSIRNSSIRSPFGVRNIKIYIDDFPFTDGGGN